MSVVVTGGAGFIGSCLVRRLNDKGIEDILIVDNIGQTEKWRNLANKKYREYIHKDTFLDKIPSYKGITHILHMGACSSTTEKDFDYLWRNNAEFTKALWIYCTTEKIPFIYASSAATYGDGSQGFDDRMDIDCLLPLNGYGYSKQVFDQWSLKQEKTPPQHVGLKFFNVYGPNEYFKGSMASMVYHGFKQIKENGRLKLFKSANPQYKDGGQLRDFVYVKDVCDVIMYFLDHSKYSGIFNVGTGAAQSFERLAIATFKALGLKSRIEYIDMPDILKEKYQYYTKAEIQSLRDIGYTKEFRLLDEGVYDYVTNHLNRGFQIY